MMAQRSNIDWLEDLHSSGERQTLAVEDLRQFILHSLPYALDERVVLDAQTYTELLAEISSKTLQYIQKNLDSFDGQSAFTTWALKIAVRMMLFELRLRRWRTVSPDDSFPGIPAGLYVLLSQHKFLKYAHEVFKEELSENQRKAIRAMVMFRMPKEEVMQRLGMERCDYFNMIHDARLRLKRRLEIDGYILHEENAAS
jgi:RNA polymerase sigma-70 factor (ECF subfamily)